MIAYFIIKYFWQKLLIQATPVRITAKMSGILVRQSVDTNSQRRRRSYETVEFRPVGAGNNESAQQSRSKSNRLCGVGDCARPRLQEPDQGRGRTAAARRGGVGRS